MMDGCLVFNVSSVKCTADRDVRDMRRAAAASIDTHDQYENEARPEIFAFDTKASASATSSHATAALPHHSACVSLPSVAISSGS